MKLLRLHGHDGRHEVARDERRRSDKLLPKDALSARTRTADLALPSTRDEDQACIET